MAKRFTDTEKWKKSFIKNLPYQYKLLWFYILDDCNVAGVWEVDIEVASLRIGEYISEEEAISVFDDKIIIIDNGEKWFIPSFIEFQYGPQLSKTNNIYRSIESVLKKHDLFEYLSIELSETGTTISALRNRISQKVRNKIFLQFEFTCQYCSSQKNKIDLVVDHFIPLSKGGDNSDENLICSCIRCNSHKTDILPDEFLAKDHSFLKPTDFLKALNNSLKAPFKNLKAPFKDLKAPFKELQEANDKDKDKEKEKEKDRQNLKIKKELTPPALEEVESYFLENGYSKVSAKKAFDYYSTANWKDSKGNSVLNWKQKMIAVWFKPENLKTNETIKRTSGQVAPQPTGYREFGGF